jgi:hypothetical protein
MAMHTESKALAALGRKKDIQVHGTDLRVLNNESPF